MDARRAAYLEALGVDVYVRRELVAPAAAMVPATAAPPSPERPARSAARAVAASPAASRADPDARAAPPDAAIEGLGWEPLRATVAECRRCGLCDGRTQTVFGVGDTAARWMFIGEAPGADEDRQGEPFVGRAGQLLTSMIRATGLRREDVYIANVLKCRPPGNRDPHPDEAAACRPYLDRQIELVNPALVVAVGRIAAQTLLGTDTPLARLRGRVHALGAARRPLVVVYHPAYLLRSPGEKRKAWLDLLQAREVYARLERGEPVLP
ncbi:MAG: uracil-DNA glycosylase [Steroidobacteraceae bacterium]